MNDIIRKIRSAKGESLAETLVALLIALLGLTILAGMIQSSSKLILSSNKVIQEYAEAGNMLAQKAGSGDTGSVSIIVKGQPGQALILTPDPGDTNTNISVSYYEEKMGNCDIISFK